MTLELIITVLFFHYIGDIICQPRVMGNNKHKDYRWLLAHVLVYTFFMLMCILFTELDPSRLFPFLTITFSTHLIIDMISSNASKHLQSKGDEYNMIAVVFLDQFLHYVQLFWTIDVLWF